MSKLRIYKFQKFKNDFPRGKRVKNFLVEKPSPILRNLVIFSKKMIKKQGRLPISPPSPPWAPFFSNGICSFFVPIKIKKEILCWICSFFVFSTEIWCFFQRKRLGNFLVEKPSSILRNLVIFSKKMIKKQ